MLAAFGLAACGGGGGGTASAPPVKTPDGGMDGVVDTTGPMATALEAAVELDGRLADVDVEQSLADAVKYAGMLSSEDVDGDSAMAAANAGMVLAANTAIMDAVTAADKVIEEANAAKTAAEDIENEAEKSAVLTVLAAAIAKANELKAKAQEIIDGTTTSGDDQNRDTLGEAVALVEGDDVDEPNSAADKGNEVAAAILAAFTDATDRIDPSTTTNQAPGGLPDSATTMHDRMGMSWHAALGMDPVKKGMLDSNNLIMQVDAVSAAGANSGTDGDLASFTAPQNIGNGASAAGTYKGIAGTVFCAGDDCKIEEDKLVGSWYFTPTEVSDGHTWQADPANMGSFTPETLFARWGYWVSVTGSGATVNTFAYSPGNTANLDLRRGDDATENVKAGYSGDAIGIAVRNKASGQFTAKVSLTATFGKDSAMLGGHISDFGGDVADPNWRVTLRTTALGDNGVISNGEAFGGTDQGAWTAQGYGPAQTPAEGGNEAVDHRPEGFFGTFDANFAEGEHAAGAYATRVD